jgi:hypothetical protein
VRVTDNGPGSLSDSRSFTVNVNADPFGPQSSDTSGLVSSDETVALSWDATVGKTYRVQYKESANANWTTLLDVIATSANESITIENGGGERFYRVVLLDGIAVDE